MSFFLQTVVAIQGNFKISVAQLNRWKEIVLGHLFLPQFGLFLFHEWLMHQKAESKKSTSHYRQPLFFEGNMRRRIKKCRIHCLRSYRKPITDQLWSYFSSSLTKKCNFINVPTRNESLSHVHLYIIG